MKQKPRPATRSEMALLRGHACLQCTIIRAEDSSHTFGWDYPPGAANDPRAPYNQGDEPDCWDCGHAENIHAIGGGKCLEDGCECKGYEAPDDLFEEDDELDPDWLVEPPEAA